MAVLRWSCHLYSINLGSRADIMTVRLRAITMWHHRRWPRRQHLRRASEKACAAPACADSGARSFFASISAKVSFPILARCLSNWAAGIRSRRLTSRSRLVPRIAGVALLSCGISNSYLSRTSKTSRVFADPILSAGLTLTHVGARELAYTILSLEREEFDPAWLKRHYNLNQRRRIHQHSPQSRRQV